MRFGAREGEVGEWSEVMKSRHSLAPSPHLECWKSVIFPLEVEKKTVSFWNLKRDRGWGIWRWSSLAVSGISFSFTQPASRLSCLGPGCEQQSEIHFLSSHVVVKLAHTLKRKNRKQYLSAKPRHKSDLPSHSQRNVTRTLLPSVRTLKTACCGVH